MLTISLQGILPPVLLAVLMMLLPIVLRKFAQFEGIPKKTGLELSLMTRFFLFQVVVSVLYRRPLAGADLSHLARFYPRDIECGHYPSAAEHHKGPIVNSGIVGTRHAIGLDFLLHVCPIMCLLSFSGLTPC